MSNVLSHLIRFASEEDGPTAVEYAVMMALVMVVCATAVAVLGTNANGTYTKVSTTVKVSGS